MTVVDRMVLAGIYTHGRVLRDLPRPGGAMACARASGQTREGVRAQGGHRVVRFPPQVMGTNMLLHQDRYCTRNTIVLSSQCRLKGRNGLKGEKKLYTNNNTVNEDAVCSL